MAKNLAEILKEANNKSTREEVLQHLIKNRSQPLALILKINFNPDFNLSLPAGEPPFKKQKDVPLGFADTTLAQESRRFYIWYDPNVNINKVRKETLFIQMLEGLHWTEAELVCQAKDKKLTDVYKNITYDIVFEAFPGLLPEKKEEAPLPLEQKSEEDSKKQKKKSSRQKNKTDGQSEVVSEVEN